MVLVSRDPQGWRESGRALLLGLWAGVTLVLLAMWVGALLLARSLGLPAWLPVMLMTLVTVVNVALARRLTRAAREPE